MNTMMIRLLSGIGLAVLAVLGADLSAAAKDATATADSKPNLSEKTIEQVQEALDKKNAIIIDARDVKDGDDIIPGAIVIPANAHVDGSIKKDDEKLVAKLKDKTEEVIVYCGSAKCPASTTLGYRLVELKDEKDAKGSKPKFPDLKFSSISHYAGGIKEWVDAGKTTEKYKAPAEEPKVEKTTEHAHDKKAAHAHTGHDHAAHAHEKAHADKPAATTATKEEVKADVKADSKDLKTHN